MNKWIIPVIAVMAISAFAVIMVSDEPEREPFGPQGTWVEIAGTGGIFYHKESLRREGKMVYVKLRNENPVALKTLNATDILFEAAFYCNRNKVRTLSKIIRYEDGAIEADDENYLEANPDTDELNETQDLMDISTTQDLQVAFWAFCE